MMLGATKTLSMLKAPGKTESPTEVTERVEPSSTMMKEGREGGGGCEEVRILVFEVV
jgi:hypothetical protein